MFPFLFKILAPLVFTFVKKKISNAIADDAEDFLKKLFKEFYITAIINVAALSLFIYAGPFFFDSEEVRFLVCSVYLSSTLHALYNFFFTYFPHIWQWVIYGGNLKKMISDEVDREIGNLSLLEYIVFSFFSSKQEAVNIIMRAIVGFMLKQGLAMVIYIVIFRVIVAPWAVEDATGLNWYEAAIYPFLMSFDYLFGFETQHIGKDYFYF